ncbi:MAG: MBL fold metallo-hydrolase [Armatimonadetes bacterium]|nr:MBL fold metallo-hydrolase [Armatimonadota bacterium]
MKIKFWGVRGSIPTPGPQTVKYGGNTSCLEIITKQGLLIIDSGSGIRELGKNLLEKNEAVKGNILLSHTHWDHIQGFPFFIPAFEKGNEFNIYGPYYVHKKLEDVLAGQMEYRYFPITLDKMHSRINFKDLKEETLEIDDCIITTKFLNHTSPTLGFKIKSDNKTLVYATDNEQCFVMPPEMINQEELSPYFNEKDWELVEFIKGVDILIHDTQYTQEEYFKKAGWGHSSFIYTLNIAKAAGIKKLILFHHDPEHSDDFLETILLKSKKLAENFEMKIFLAQEKAEFLI